MYGAFIFHANLIFRSLLLLLTRTNSLKNDIISKQPMLFRWRDVKYTRAVLRLVWTFDGIVQN